MHYATERHIQADKILQYLKSSLGKGLFYWERRHFDLDIYWCRLCKI